MLRLKENVSIEELKKLGFEEHTYYLDSLDEKHQSYVYYDTNSHIDIFIENGNEIMVFADNSDGYIDSNVLMKFSEMVSKGFVEEEKIW